MIKTMGHIYSFSVYKAVALVQRPFSVTQAKIDYTQKFNLQTWHNFGTKMQGVSQLNKTSIGHCKVLLTQ